MLYWRFPALYNIGSHLPFTIRNLRQITSVISRLDEDLTQSLLVSISWVLTNLIMMPVVLVSSWVTAAHLPGRRALSRSTLPLFQKDHARVTSDLFCSRRQLYLTSADCRQKRCPAKLKPAYKIARSVFKRCPVIKKFISVSWFFSSPPLDLLTLADAHCCHVFYSLQL